MDPVTTLWLASLALGAAIINGAVGYGFSSIVTPIAILWIPNRILNPSLVLVELAVNAMLLVRERHHLSGNWIHSRPIVATLLPGVIFGTIGLALLPVSVVKFVVYVVLLPLIFVQLAGVTRPINNGLTAGVALGPAIGSLYALTTISGPPLALFFRNQGLEKQDLRAVMAQVRFAESSLTLGAYAAATSMFGDGLVTLPTFSLLPFLLVPVIVGVPIGAALLSRVSAESFRKLVMNVDGLIVSYGLSQAVLVLGWMSRPTSYGLLALLALIVIGMTLIVLARERSSRRFTSPSKEAGVERSLKPMLSSAHAGREAGSSTADSD